MLYCLYCYKIILKNENNIRILRVDVTLSKYDILLIKKKIVNYNVYIIHYNLSYAYNVPYNKIIIVGFNKKNINLFRMKTFIINYNVYNRRRLSFLSQWK